MREAIVRPTSIDIHRPRVAAFVLACAVLAAVATAGGAQSSTAGPVRAAVAEQLSRSISVARMRADLRALERIADRNGGSRAAGTPGYAASVRYVRDQLRRAGYVPRVTPFPFVSYLETLERGRQIAPLQRDLPLEALEYSPSTPAGGIRARVVESGDGCSPGDFDAVVRGLIGLVERGTCFFAVKAANAANAGAVALLVFNSEAGQFDGTLGGPQASSIPVAGIAQGLGRELAATENAVVELELETVTRRTTSQNVMADSRPGAARVLVVGGHLDSVPAGAGINDNGSGVAAILEIARALRKSPRPLDVRFAFWGAEELGLFGSRAYAGTLDPSRIVGYLNFDVLGSPAGRYGVYGSDRYAAAWLRYFASRGADAVRIDPEGRSDHAPFSARGIQIGGLYAGDYACYHRACDRVAGIDFTALRELAAAAAFGVASFAPRR